MANVGYWFRTAAIEVFFAAAFSSIYSTSVNQNESAISIEQLARRCDLFGALLLFKFSSVSISWNDFVCVTFKLLYYVITSVADPGCLSRIRLFSIPDPGSKLFPSRIPSPGSTSKNSSIVNPKK
jgi:hypothetical protein